MKKRRPVGRIGHRGAPLEVMENTLASFERAFERGADAIELDVHATADGVVVVHHDPTVPSADEPGFRDRRPIAKLTSAQLRSAQLRSTQLSGSSDGRARIPTLTEVLAVVPPGATVYVEIKATGIESLVAQTIASSSARCAVHSFDENTIREMRALAPAVPRGLLFDEYPRDVANSMHRAAARDMWPRWELIDRQLVEAVHAQRGRVIAWTVNSLDAATELVRLGVDGLCSDDVRLFEAL